VLADPELDLKQGDELCLLVEESELDGLRERFLKKTE
jgi:hypothetical protein